MKKGLVSLLLVLSATQIVSGCGTSPSGRADSAHPAPPSLEATTPDAALIEVPDVITAVASHSFRNSSSTDRKNLPAEITEYVRSIVESAGLTADITLQATSLEDTQSPPPGSRVPTETTVTVLIGFGD